MVVRSKNKNGCVPTSKFGMPAWRFPRFEVDWTTWWWSPYLMALLDISDAWSLKMDVKYSEGAQGYFLARSRMITMIDDGRLNCRLRRGSRMEHDWGFAIWGVEESSAYLKVRNFNEWGGHMMCITMMVYEKWWNSWVWMFLVAASIRI
jgi:hypothetical protein